MIYRVIKEREVLKIKECPQMQVNIWAKMQTIIN